MELIKLLLTKEREFVSQYMDTTNMTDEEVDKIFDIIVKEVTNERIIQWFVDNGATFEKTGS